MTIRHPNIHHHDWKHIVDLETLWILAYSAAIVGSWVFALVMISRINAFP